MTHPLVTALFEEKDRQGVTYDRLSETSGVSRSALVYWKAGKREPGVMSLQAAFNALGVDLVAVKAGEQMQKIAWHKERQG